MDWNNNQNGSNESNVNEQNNGYPVQNPTGNMQPNNQNSNYQDYTANNMYYQAPDNNGVENKANGKQIAGLVFGILAICSSCCYGVPGVIFGIVGLVLSILGNKKSKHGIGVAGLVCSIIGLLLGIAMTVYFATALVALVNDDAYKEMIRKVKEMVESGDAEGAQKVMQDWMNERLNNVQ